MPERLYKSNVKRDWSNGTNPASENCRSLYRLRYLCGILQGKCHYRKKRDFNSRSYQMCPVRGLHPVLSFRSPESRTPPLPYSCGGKTWTTPPYREGTAHPGKRGPRHL